MNMTTQTIEPILLKMIDVFREEFSKLSDGEKNQKQRINSLDAPCQIYLVSSPSKKSHLLIKTHFDTLPDKSINLLNLSGENYIQEIDEFYKKFTSIDEQANQPMGKIKMYTNYRASIKNGLVELGKSVREGRERDNYSGIGTMSLLENSVAQWNISGNLESIDFIAQVKNHIKEYKDQYARAQKEKLETKPKQVKEYNLNIKKGFGVYFYPPLLIGDFNPTIKERIENKEYDLLNEKIIDEIFEGVPLIIKKEGLIGLQTENKKTADNILHTIMGTALLMGLDVHAHKNSELVDLSFNIKDNQVSISSWTPSSLRNQLLDPMSRFMQPRQLIVRHEISIEEIISILEKAKEIYKNQRNLDSLKLILSSFTYYANEDFSQSFILSWTIIEKHLIDLWENKLNSSNISNTRIKDLSNWDSHKITEILHLDGIISDDDYFDIVSLRGLRNNLFHRGQGVTEKQTQKCYQVAFEIITKSFEVTPSLKAHKFLTI